MWSGPAGQATAISFGKTSAQFCAFLVVRPPDDARLYVLGTARSRPELLECRWSLGESGGKSRKERDRRR
jgi:hypothetical protein